MRETRGGVWCRFSEISNEVFIPFLVRPRNNGAMHLRIRISLLIAAAATAALTAVSSAAPRADLTRGVVDITTTLGYQEARAAGTGLVLTADGEVLTNNHVIKGATVIHVYIPSTHRTYPAHVLGYSVQNDVALLKLDGASKLDTVQLGNSSSVHPGDAVTKVGNALGVGGVPSSGSGLVRGLGRTITAQGDDGLAQTLGGLIETSVPLQPGDSGGALLNASGVVVGMNAAASRGYGYSDQTSAAFAITINRALWVRNQIIAGHSSATIHVGETPFLGITVRSPASSSTGGLLISGVVGSGPAARAGISPGDVLTKLDGKPLASPQTLTKLLLRSHPGTTVHMTVLDASTGSTALADVVLGSGPPQ